MLAPPKKMLFPYLVAYSASAVTWAVSTAFVHYAVLRRRHRAFLPVSLAAAFLASPLK